MCFNASYIYKKEEKKKENKPGSIRESLFDQSVLTCTDWGFIDFYLNQVYKIIYIRFRHKISK